MNDVGQITCPWHYIPYKVSPAEVGGHSPPTDGSVQHGDECSVKLLIIIIIKTQDDCKADKSVHVFIVTEFMSHHHKFQAD